MTSNLTTVPNQQNVWDEWHRTHSNASKRSDADDIIGQFTRSLSKGHQRRILEVGSGQGREAIALARNGLLVSAFDLSPLALTIARANASAAGVNIDFRQHDTAQPLPYESASFCGIFAHLSLHYFDSTTTRRIFAELARVTVPSGVILLTVRSIYDKFYGLGDRIDDNLFCHEGHIRGFFDIPHIISAARGWDIRQTEYFDVYGERKDNPGSFLKVIARRL